MKIDSPRLHGLFLAASLGALASGCGGGGDGSPAPSPAPSTPQAVAGDCGSLVNLVPSITGSVSSAVMVAASASAPFVTPANVISPTPLNVTRSFCRVTGVLRPGASSSINFEVWLPPKSAWNGKFLGNADGGSTGAILYASMIDPLNRGYSTMGHDNGHTSTNAFEQSWAVDASGAVKTDAITDFGYRAQHTVTVVSKELTQAFYGAPPAHSYYAGCSQGGHHGMMEVNRYPDDYDGVVAGAHGGDWLGMMSSEAYAAIATLKNNRAGGLTTAQLGALNRATIAACDAIDGVVDGQIEDPRQCRYDPAAMQCGAAGADPATCLSAAQVQATRDIYTGPRRSTGESVSPGYAVGSEGFWTTTWNSATVAQSGSYNDFFRLIVKKNAAFDITNLNFDSDIDLGRQLYGTIYDAVNPDLSRFAAKGKLIMYHGWADPLISSYLTVNAWTRIQDNMGAANVKGFARMFMVPGMGHCAGGPIGTADWLTPLENWVEKGIAPDATTPANTILGTGTSSTGSARSRPICPYPQVARYSGSGDINLAANFSCADPG